MNACVLFSTILCLCSSLFSMLRSNKTDVCPEDTIETQIYHYGELPTGRDWCVNIQVNKCMFWSIVALRVDLE